MSKQKQRYLSVLIVPHSEKASKSFRLPVVLVKLLSVALVTSIFLLGVFIYNYQGMVLETNEMDELRRINAEQEKNIDELADKTNELEEQLSLLAKTEREIRELADLEDFEDIDKEFEEGIDDIEPDEDLWVHAGGYNGKDELAGDNTADDNKTEITKETIRLLNMQLPEQKESFESTKLSLEDKKEEQKHTPDIWPLEGRISSSYGYRNSPLTGVRQFHKGIDIAAPYRTPVKAAANGRVTYSSYRSGHGNLLILNHGYGYKTYYAHLSSFEAKEEEEVEKGDVIGYVGSTGNSTGPHLHYEVHVNNNPVDPKEFLP